MSFSNITIAFLIVNIVLVLHIYAGYPLILYLLDLIKFRSVRDGKTVQLPISLNRDSAEEFKSITIIVPAHNEESVIADKLRNHIELNYFPQKLKIVVVADNCTDNTTEIVGSFIRKYPDLIRLEIIEGGQGKTNAINTVMQHVTSDISVFCDANVHLRDDALLQISSSLSLMDVGGVAGQLSYINSQENNASEASSLYWRYEEWIKTKESNVDSIMGADGSIFAIKTELYSDLPVYVLDDFCTSIGVLIKNKKFKFNSQIKAYERTTSNWSDEFQRKVRIATRSFDSYRFLRKDVLKKLTNLQLFMFYSHKVIRWYTFIFLSFIVVSSCCLAITQSEQRLWSLFLGVQLLSLLLFSTNFVFPRKLNLLNKLSRAGKYFLLANVATSLGVFRSIRGKKIQSWKSVQSSRS